jgi:putative glutamine amidotransferase
VIIRIPEPGDLNVSSSLAQSVPEARHSRLTATRPTVAVSATSDDSLGGAHRVRLNSAYVTALENAGLVPVVIPPLTGREAAREIVARVDGVVLTGGEDVDPSLYGQARLSQCGKSNVQRDNTEIALVHAARELGVPLLAICRGPQLLNVALGGTLFQDIPSQIPSEIDHNPKHDRNQRAHPVTVEPGSRIASAVQATSLSVNSFHHQSVREVGQGLKVTARAPDGVIEGLESTDDSWWVMAVQWHPEEMNDSPEPWDRGLFRAFADRLTAG